MTAPRNAPPVVDLADPKWRERQAAQAALEARVIERLEREAATAAALSAVTGEQLQRMADIYLAGLAAQRARPPRDAAHAAGARTEAQIAAWIARFRPEATDLPA